MKDKDERERKQAVRKVGPRLGGRSVAGESKGGEEEDKGAAAVDSLLSLLSSLTLAYPLTPTYDQ